MAVGVHLPSGFSYDPATGAISGEFARMGASSPKAYVGQAYITQIDVTRTGGTLPSQTISLTGTPPPTSASFTVTPGEVYNFSATIYTNLSSPMNVMSGGTLSPVTAPADGQATSVDINIPGFNGAPVVTFTSDNITPGAGTAHLTCSSADPDADTVTYIIRTVSPPVGASALNVDPATAGTPYTYTAGIASQIDLECIATDAYGAIGYGKLLLNPGASAGAPIAPTGVVAVGANSQVAVQWNAATGATSYNVYWGTTAGITTASSKITGVTSPYVHTGRTNGTPYFYAVTAVSAAGESGLSAEVSATPAPSVVAPIAPTGVTAVGANAQVTTSWGASVGATSYNLYWSATPGVTTASAKITGATSPYIHGGLTNGVPYYYAITAVNMAGESGLSAEVSATPQPSAPTGVSAVGTNTQVTVSWTPAAGATSYNLYWGTAPGITTASNKIAGVVTAYTHAGRTNGTQYYYAVTAVSGAGESALSAEVSAKATLKVTKTADTNDGVCDADCSLREAISYANAGAGGETIVIPAGTYTITIAGVGEDLNATGDFDIAKNVTITGVGAGSTIINGGGLDRVFHITGAYTISISDITITGGTNGGLYNLVGTVTVANSTISSNSGGGIVNGNGVVPPSNGTITITNCIISNNSNAGTYAGGVYNGVAGTVAIANTTINGNTAAFGGAIYGGGGAVTTITNSTISGNSATQGGAIYGKATITDTTISGNTVNHQGGGIWVPFLSTVVVTNSTISGNTATAGFGYGGGIYVEGALTVTNSTISGNTALQGGGIYGRGTLTNSTISGNSTSFGAAGIQGSAASFTLSNTIVANQASGPDCQGGGLIISSGYNLESSTTCGFLSAGDLQNTNPLLGPLSNNGGVTQTMALSVGSPAIDTGSCATATDQRGTARPQGLGCDIGAYEK